MPILNYFKIPTGRCRVCGVERQLEHLSPVWRPAFPNDPFESRQVLKRECYPYSVQRAVANMRDWVELVASMPQRPA